MSYDSFGDGDYLSGTFSSTYDTPITLVAWVKRTAAEWADTSADFIINFGDDFADRFDALGIGAGQAADTVIMTAASASTQDIATLAHTDGEYDDIWVPVIATFTASNDRDLYIEDTTNTQPDTTDRDEGSALDSFMVGSRLDNNQQFAGKIAEVAVFDKVLSADEINALQSMPQHGPPPNSVAPNDCIGYWSLSTDQSSHADESGNGGPALAESGTVAFNSDHPTIGDFPVIQTYAWRDEDTSGGNTCIADRPTGITVGDLLLIMAMCDSVDTGPVFSDNLTDWDFDGTVGNANSATHIGFFSKIADGTEAATETITFSGTASFRGAAYFRIDGHHTTAWLDDLQTTTQESDQFAQDIAAATSTVGDCLVLYGILSDGGDTYPHVPTVANGWIATSQFISEQIRTDSAGFAASFGRRGLISAGSTGIAEIDTTTEQETSASFQLAIAPAAGVTITVVDGDNAWDDGDTGLVITGTGFT
jgi:hypothetical protein